MRPACQDGAPGVMGVMAEAPAGRHAQVIMQIPSIYTMLFYLQTQQPRGLVSYSAQPQRLGMSGFYTYFAVYAGGALLWQARPAAAARAWFGCDALRTPESAAMSARAARSAMACSSASARPAALAASGERRGAPARLPGSDGAGGVGGAGWPGGRVRRAGGCVLHDAARVHPAGLPHLPHQRAGRVLGRVHSLGQPPAGPPPAKHVAWSQHA